MEEFSFQIIAVTALAFGGVLKLFAWSQSKAFDRKYDIDAK
jgi:hypothetical protein